MSERRGGKQQQSGKECTIAMCGHTGSEVLKSE
jgi:hypothetical protein